MNTKVSYQVLNSSGLPASGPQHDLAVFPSQRTAKDWIDYLVNECDVERDEITIREVLVSLPLTYPGGEEL
ncbi:MAG TPA: hypothetical protein DDW94_11605 [Deltaproteobacteria bacterium]|nr:MAG: hypothetical protein A2Z79_05160 [Deltaproteobacteria bacterium GWA2_55_82]OGQ63837.1 MAG: hypothetical protein A3I81_12490 [Deltaproteobacteria bacterium RIFCSPLOWO2_02_FULL_55_12]OIJ72704.1 MAG: hypothetical protein A2V21_312735 [Deltaproteobacteria bacterium GWC2_55_46]HBG47615.1 hypothetical protein [Deltaproteobacteria bacterium]HCY10526.1 hypothetical protein [Deltaproteobacteria bacterium]